MTEPTEEQRQKAHEEAQEILRRIMTGEDKPKRPKKQPVFSEEERARRRRAAMKYDHDEIVTLYDKGNGMTSRQIADKLGADRKTIVNILRKKEVYNPAREGRGGRPLSEFCDKGHDQAVWRRDVPRGSGKRWHCGKCHLEREAEYQKQRTIRRRDNRLQKHGNGWEVIIEGVSRGVALMSDETAATLDAKLRSLSRRRGIKHDD